MPDERIRYVEDPRFPGMRIPVSATNEKELDRLSDYDSFLPHPIRLNQRRKIGLRIYPISLKRDIMNLSKVRYIRLVRVKRDLI